MDFFERLTPFSPSPERKEILMQLVAHIRQLQQENKAVQLNFICTHNSRRSQLSQLLAKVMAEHYAVAIETFSGGVEVTACNERVIHCLERLGFNIQTAGEKNNPHYTIGWGSNVFSVLFSKMYDDPTNPKENFVAVMTCDHADKNCPFIPGADLRIPIRYTDPKAFDDTPDESKAYLNKALEIGQEMKFVFEQLSQKK